MTNTEFAATGTNDKSAFDLDRFTAWQIIKGTSGISLCGCIDAAKLGDSVRSAVDTALAIYETMSADGDDYFITNLADEFSTIARQLYLLKGSVAPCADLDSDLDSDHDNDDCVRWRYLDPDDLIRRAVDGGRDEYNEYDGVRDAYRRAVADIIDCNLSVDWGWQFALLSDEYDRVLDIIDAKLGN